MRNTILYIFAAVLVICLLGTCATSFIWAYPSDVIPNYDRYSYTAQKEVENTCRAMVASYKADVLTYQQFKDGDEIERQWAAQAKMRANKTASNYNNYILKNYFIWYGNIPKDIRTRLDIVE